MMSGLFGYHERATTMMLATTSTIWFWLMVCFIAYFLPTMIAGVRKAPNAASVFIVNFFLGWTFIAWVVALAMAVRDVPDNSLTR